MIQPARQVWLAFAVLLAISAIPIFSTVLPPLFDYPNHLARMHLLAEGGNRFYQVRWSPLPNLAEDLIVPVLARIIPLALAGRLFLIATFALIAGGAVWLGREATGGWRFWPLTSFLLLYNRMLLWGFVNYLFGIGVALCGGALWLRLEQSRARIVVSALVGLACYLSHIEAFGFYGLLIAGLEAGPAITELRSGRWAAFGRRLAMAAAPFMVPIALFLGTWQGAAAGHVSYGNVWRKADLLFSIFDNYNRPFDVGCFVLFLATLGSLVATGRFRLAPRVGWAAGFVFAAYLLLPSQLYSGSGADHRLPVALFLLLVAGAAPSFPSRRIAVACGTGLGLLFLARFAMIERIWLQSDRVYTADLAGLDLLPEGARLAVAFPPGALNVVSIPETHLPTLAIARREAFVPTLFAFPAQQPIAVAAPYAALAASASPEDLWAAFVGRDQAKRAMLAPVLAGFDYVAFTDRESFAVPADPCLKEVYSAPRFQILAIAPGC